jgi:hypothetical protein
MLLDKGTRTILWMHTETDVRTRPDPEDIFNLLRK